MPDEQALTPEQLARQARQHLDGLRAAGVEWLPNAPPPAVIVTARPAEAPAPATSLPVLSEPAPVQGGLLALGEAPSAGGGLTRDQRKRRWPPWRSGWRQCQRCPALASTRTQTVFGTGALDPELCFIGEAPGADEDRLGEPFVGRGATPRSHHRGLRHEARGGVHLQRAAVPSPREPYPAGRRGGQLSRVPRRAPSTWCGRSSSAAWGRARRRTSWARRSRSESCAAASTTTAASRSS